MTDQSLPDEGGLTEAEAGIWDDGFVAEGGPDPLPLDEAERLVQAAVDADAPVDYATDDTEDDTEGIK